MGKFQSALAVPHVAVEGGGVFPVRRIYCVGRNYADHAREMGGDPGREPPFFFSKPADAAIQGHAVPYPPMTANLHHEVELVVALKAGGRDLSPEDADAAIFGYAVGVDLTRRDLQEEAKKTGRPWDMAKGFDASAPIGRILPAERAKIGPETRLRLSVDGAEKQNGTLSQMIWSAAEIVANLSALVEVKAGDLIFTGTPSGVGPLTRGARVEAKIDGLPRLLFTVK
jgi:fumarylpyruvate hydrolase